MTAPAARLLALAVRSGRILSISLPDGGVDVLTDQAGPVPDGVHVEGGTAYWTTMGRPEVLGPTEAERLYTKRDGGVHAISLDGSGLRDVLAEGGITTGKQITGDGAGTLYWSDREGCRVSRCRTDGSGLIDLVVRMRDDSWTQECVGVAVDATSLYWTQKGPAKGGRGRIFRAPLEPQRGHTAADRTDVELLWDDLPEPIDLHLATDQDGAWLYWTDRGAEPGGNTLNRARVPAAGTRGAAPEILASGFAEAIGLAVDPAARVAYVSDLGGAIRAVPLPGGAGDERVLLDAGEAITGLALVR